MKIFISGPMSGKPEYNFPEFNKRESILRNQGWEVVNPVTICELYGGAEKVTNDKHLFDLMIDKEITELKKCDAIYMLKGWEDSCGAFKEYFVARRLHLYCMYEENGFFKRIIRNLRNWAYEC